MYEILCKMNIIAFICERQLWVIDEFEAYVSLIHKHTNEVDRQEHDSSYDT